MVVRDGITERELSLMKMQARASILLSLEDSASRAGSLAQCEMVHGRQIPVEETLKNLNAVTTDDVRAVAREFLTTEKIAFVALGDLEDFDVSRSRLTI
jgi:predicted Zn-dependent peptidase